MDTIRKQVADLQQKIDYLIDQMALLTGESHLPQKSVVRSPLRRKSVDLAEAERLNNPQKPIGLNRFRALQNEK